MYPKVRQQVMDRIATFEKVIKDHETAQKEALKTIYEQLEDLEDVEKLFGDDIKSIFNYYRISINVRPCNT